MRIFGTKNFGWRISNILASALCILPLYIFSRLFLTKIASLFAVLVACFSQFWLADTYTGYGWTIPRLFILLSLASFALAIKTHSITSVITLALACCYARLSSGMAAITPIVCFVCAILFFLNHKIVGRELVSHQALDQKNRISYKWFIFILACLIIFPLLICELPKQQYKSGDYLNSGYKNLLWKTSLGPLITYYKGPNWRTPPQTYKYPFKEFLRVTRDNTIRTVLAPLTFIAKTHYIIGFIITPVSCALIMLGLLVSLIRIKDSYIFLLCYLSWMCVAGVIAPYHEYHDLVDTRLVFLMPFWGILAGYAIQFLIQPVQCRETVAKVFVIIISIVIIYLNMLGFYVDIPRRYRNSQVSLAFKALKESHPEARIYVMGDNWEIIKYISEQYPDGDRLIQFKADEINDFLPFQEFTKDDEFLFYDISGQSAEIFNWFCSKYPNAIIKRYKDSSGLIEVHSCKIIASFTAR